MNHIENRPDAPKDAQIPGVIEAVLPDPNLIEKVSPWRMNFRQLEPGQMQADIRVRQGSIVSLLEISINRAVHQVGAAPPDTLTFGMPLSRKGLRWRGKETRADHFLTFGDENGFDGLSDRSFHGLTVSVATTDIEMLANRLGLPYVDKLRSSGLFAAQANAATLRILSKRTMGFLRPAPHSLMDVSDEEGILALFLQMSGDVRDSEDQSSGHSRARAVRRAVEFMEAHIEDNVPVSRICEAAGVSVRTLSRAFHEAFGLGPKAYYLRMRLSQLRCVLLDSENPAIVSHAAHQFGFWHLGQLAKDYRAHFGELPSETRQVMYA